MPGKKDISKLIPIKIVDKLGRVMTVYVHPREYPKTEYPHVKKLSTKIKDTEQLVLWGAKKWYFDDADFELDKPAPLDGTVRIVDNASKQLIWEGKVRSGEKKISSTITTMREIHSPTGVLVRVSPHLKGGTFKMIYRLKKEA
jgi:hypothetical protein